LERKPRTVQKERKKREPGMKWLLVHMLLAMGGYSHSASGWILLE
jgi:hypothetical protein